MALEGKCDNNHAALSRLVLLTLPFAISKGTLDPSGAGAMEPQPYTTTGVIGTGTFGVVYQAQSTEDSGVFAVKKVLQDKRFKVGSTPRSSRSHLRAVRLTFPSHR